MQGIRYFFLSFFALLMNMTFGQIILPAFQGAQYLGQTSAPALTGLDISSIAGSTASSGGTISSEGGSPVTARGVCWSASPGPTIALATKTSNGIGTGSFTSAITGLTTNVTYYVRAYATNSLGTAYGAQYSFTTADISIGSDYQGGRVAYILNSGDAGYDAGAKHGLIATESDVASGTEYKWHNGTDLWVTTSTGYGTGRANTDSTVVRQGAGTYAASICASLVWGGYDDWFLPSKDELNLLYINRSYFGSFGPYYWSSSEGATNNRAWRQNYVSAGAQTTVAKAGLMRVRAVRYF